MPNTFIVYMNATNSTFSFYDCLKQTHVGTIVNYVVMLLCFFLGTPAHSWLLWLSLLDGWKIKPTQLFYLNLNVLELIYCFQCAIEMFNVLIFNSGTSRRIAFIVFGLSCIGRPLMQMCVSIEQYLAVLHPMIFLKYKDVQYRIASTAVVLLMMAIYGVYEAFSDIYPDPIFNSVSFIAVVVISFCCVSVLHALKHPGPGDTQNTMERSRDVGSQQKRNTFNIIFSGLLITLFSYLPQAVVGLIFVIKIDRELFLCKIVPIINSFSVLSVLITPLLKLYKGGQFKCLNNQREINS